VRAPLAALALIALTVGCGSTTSPSQRSAPAPGSLEALWRNSGESVSLIPGTSDYSPGELRISFLVVDPRGRVIAPSHAQVWIARSLRAKPFAQSVARLEPIGVPGVSTGADAKAIYVAHIRVPEPGTYHVLARPIGGPVRIGGIRELLVRSRSATPAVGARAYPSRTPTLADTGGRTAPLTTRVPPDRPLLRTSVAAALAAHEPFVVTFATPRYCVSRTCGPVVDVVDHARRRYARTRIRFIHVEIYKDNNPRRGPNRWVREWHLPGEPWTFLVGRDGRIKAKFEGSVSPRELEEAIRRFLL
jgi:hypothetical protein